MKKLTVIITGIIFLLPLRAQDEPFREGRFRLNRNTDVGFGVILN